MYYDATYCCAMDLLCNVHGGDPLASIQANLKHRFTYDKLISPTLILCVTGPGEDPELEEKLIKIGFKKFTEFSRRGSYLSRLTEEEKEKAPLLTLWGIKKDEVLG